jgi:hypothetical protein
MLGGIWMALWRVARRITISAGDCRAELDALIALRWHDAEARAAELRRFKADPAYVVEPAAVRRNA